MTTRALLILAALSACGKKHDTPAAAAVVGSGTGSAPGAAPRAAAPALPDANAPIVSVTAARAYQGWPLIVLARVSVRTPTKLALDAFHIIVTAKGAPQTWPLHLATKASAPLSLDSQTVAVVAWTLSPDDTAKLDGDFKITVRADQAVGTALVPIHAAPAAADPGLALARWHLVQADQAAAQKDVDAYLAKHPDDRHALMLAGDLLAAAHKPADAIEVYQRALRSEGEPDRVLAAHQRAALQQLTGP